MPRCVTIALTLCLAGPAVAQPVADASEQAVIDANRAIRAHNDKIEADNAAAQAAYREEVARVEAQRRANEASFAAATAAYEAKQARYEADMAGWRAESVRIAAQSRAPGRPPAAEAEAKADTKADGGDAHLICRRITPTGTHAAGPRICKTQAGWQRESAGR